LERHRQYSVAILMDALHIHQVATMHRATGELVEVMPEHRAEPMPVALLYPPRQSAPAALVAPPQGLRRLAGAAPEERLFA
jgi:hypothetical protein